MSKTSRASSFDFTRRSVISLSAVAWCTALVSAGGCDTADPGSSGPLGVAGSATIAGSGAGGLTGSSGAKSTGGTAAVTGGAPATAVGGSATGGAVTGPANGGGGGASGGSGGGGGSGVVAGSGGVNNSGGAATGGKPCVDVEPPADPKWPGATCQNWANETTECKESWFANYCDVSCGRCVPTGGSGGGASGGSGGAPPKVCMDVQPPEDPEWPGATCAEWAAEAKACSEDWFANYCDVTCGRCTPPPGSGGSGGGSGAVDCSNSGNPNVNGNEGYATRYWDCCQTHCAQFDGHKCGQDGTSRTGDNTSSCNGGGSFACYDEAPKAVNDCLSYGYIAKANPDCGGCYRIQFTGQGYHNANDPGSVAIKGKQMIVKVSNTGGDVANNQFDLMVPGGGVGRFNACSRQWGTNDLGAQYGGFLTNCTGSHQAKKDCVRQNCMKIPAGPARDGCLWFVDWFQVADNPKFTSQQTNCPF